jgi:hypothetical protein
MNYRSVVVFGTATEVRPAQRKLDAFQALVEQVAPGRWQDARQPSAKELKATLVLELPLREVSAKVRTGPPKDSAEDIGLPVWAGEVPLRLTALAPVPDPELPGSIPIPAYAANYRR